MLVVFLTTALAAWTIRVHRHAALGWLWFLATIASTLPLIPARNALAADRYMYLPIIGLAWVAALVGQRIVSSILSLGSRSVKLAFFVPLGLVLPSAMIAVSWHTASFYESTSLKCERIADLFPTAPRVWERAASVAYDEGKYANAINLARKEFIHENVNAKSAALMIIGKSQFELGLLERQLLLSRLVRYGGCRGGLNGLVPLRFQARRDHHLVGLVQNRHVGLDRLEAELAQNVG